MPRHANDTSFKPGHKRSAESIEKQRATINGRVAAGEWHRVSVPWTDDRRKRHAAAKRAQALGNTRLADCNGYAYRQVMTLDGYRYEHRVVMEQVLGRKLERSEHVHHINEDTLDNHPENLEVKAHGQHTRHHHTGRPSATKGQSILPPGAWSRKFPDGCIDCGTTDRPHISKGRCGPCHQRWYRQKRNSEGWPIPR